MDQRPLKELWGSLICKLVLLVKLALTIAEQEHGFALVQFVAPSRLSVPFVSSQHASRTRLNKCAIRPVRDEKASSALLPTLSIRPDRRSCDAAALLPLGTLGRSPLRYRKP